MYIYVYISKYLYRYIHTYIYLLPIGSEEREVFGVGSFPVAILPPSVYKNIEL